MKQFVFSIVAFWQETWRQNRLLFWAEAGGTVCGMAAATFMALGAPDPNLWVVFGLYEVSAVLMMYSTYQRHSSWMFVLMLFYFVVTGIGLIRLALGA